MASDLATTNALLAVMAAVSVLEALALVGLFTGGLLLYRRTMRAIAGIEARHVAPAAERINAILDDVKGVTSVVKEAVDDADAGARWGLAWLISRLRPGRHAA